MDTSEKRTCVILTALPVEFEAVLAHLEDTKEQTHPQGTIYRIGTFEGWRIAAAEIGAGNNGAALEAERAISHFSPEAIFFVGVAGGIKDVKLGDVVAGTKVYGYESGRDDKDFEPRPDLEVSSYPLVHRARSVQSNNRWQKRIFQLAVPIPSVFVGPIAAGEKVIANKEASLAAFLKTQYGDSLAVEMEGRGFLAAAYANRSIDAIVIRGISDLLSEKARSDKEGWQKHASDHAAAFAFEMLHEMGGGADTTPTSQSSNKDKNFDTATHIARLIEDASNPEKKLAHVMTEAYSKISSGMDADDKAWLNCEISGYEREVVDSNIWPQYRSVLGQVVVNDPTTGANPVAFTDRKHGESVSVTPITSSIGQLEYSISQNEGYEIAYVPETEKQLMDGIHSSIAKDYGTRVANSKLRGCKLTRWVSTSHLIGIVDKTRTKFIDLLEKVKVRLAKSAVSDASTTAETLRKFRATPLIMQGTTIDLNVRFCGAATPVSESMCEALGLTFGASLKRRIEVLVPAEQQQLVDGLKVLYASRNKCEWLDAQPENSETLVKVWLTFGKETRHIKVDPVWKPGMSTHEFLHKQPETRTEEEYVSALVLD